MSRLAGNAGWVRLTDEDANPIADSYPLRVGHAVARTVVTGTAIIHGATYTSAVLDMNGFKEVQVFAFADQGGHLTIEESDTLAMTADYDLLTDQDTVASTAYRSAAFTPLLRYVRFKWTNTHETDPTTEYKFELLRRG